MAYQKELLANRLFANLDQVQIQEALDFFDTVVTYERFALIIKEGDNDSKLYAIEAGELIIKAGGKEVASLTVGDIVGEVGFIASGKRTANVFAGPNGATLRIITPKSFREFGRMNPYVAFVISQNINFLLASKLQRTNLLLKETIARLQGMEEARSQSVFKRLLGSFGV